MAPPKHLVNKLERSLNQALLSSSPTISPLTGETELFCIQHGNLLGKHSLWNWKLNVTVWELLFVLDFVSSLLLIPLLFYSVSGSFCLSLHHSLLLPFCLYFFLNFPFTLVSLVILHPPHALRTLHPPTFFTITSLTQLSINSPKPF